MGFCQKLCRLCLGCAAVLVASLSEHPLARDPAVLVAAAIQWLRAASFVEEPPADMVPAPALPIPALLLPGGALMPSVGLGLCCRLTAVGDAVRNSVLWYLLLGGRHLDGAEIYGNHAAVGEGIRRAIARGVPREEIFFSTKIPGHLFGTSSTEKWFEKMLNETRLDYVDLVLLHAAGPEKGAKQDLECGSMPDMRRCREETWLALDGLRRQGKVRHLGVSNFGPRQMQELLALGSAPLAVNQLEYHPWVRGENREAVDFCHRHGIGITASSLFGGAPRSRSTMQDQVLDGIARAHGKSAMQVLLRWAYQQNISAVAGTGNPKHMQANMDVFGFELSGDDMRSIGQLSLGKRVEVHPQHVLDAIL